VTYRYLADPCRNFCIFNMLPLTDPRDGREKLCLSNFTAGGTGNLIFVDVATGGGVFVDVATGGGVFVDVGCGGGVFVEVGAGTVGVGVAHG
jgi:hypothetical protein